MTSSRFFFFLIHSIGRSPPLCGDRMRQRGETSRRDGRKHIFISKFAKKTKRNSHFVLTTGSPRAERLPRTFPLIYGECECIRAAEVMRRANIRLPNVHYVGSFAYKVHSGVQQKRLGAARRAFVEIEPINLLEDAAALPASAGIRFGHKIAGMLIECAVIQCWR